MNRFRKSPAWRRGTMPSLRRPTRRVRPVPFETFERRSDRSSLATTMERCVCSTCSTAKWSSNFTHTLHLSLLSMFRGTVSALLHQNRLSIALFAFSSDDQSVGCCRRLGGSCQSCPRSGSACPERASWKCIHLYDRLYCIGGFERLYVARGQP